MDDERQEYHDEQSKPVMLFGRDIRTIPCFKYSMLYGIYGGFAGGLATFLFTSRVNLATNAALASYMGIATAYWCYCRYNYVMTKYSINEIQQIIQQSGDNKQELEEYLQKAPARKLEDA